MSPLRNELKFIVHHSVRRLLIERWHRYLVRAPYTNEDAVSPVLSLYYDSPRLTFHYDKLDGFELRQKVRMRTYAREFRPGHLAVLEIKQRVGDRVRKHRHAIRDFRPSHLDPPNWPIDDPIMRGRFCDLLERYRLRPSAQVYYQREAYEGVVESDVRVTFDTCVTGLHPGERLTRERLFDRARRLLPDTLAILEIKATRGLPGWVHEWVGAAELQQQTLPKYCTAVEVLGLPELWRTGVYA
ncbi:MAG: polyphosphate polymerase domain-containing protein [Candidatus Rokubacteria bacterium]|nr:polyphosphate polymerase domain-containing protein [Candidatus Rokubacteria bacterium]